MLRDAGYSGAEINEIVAARIAIDGSGEAERLRDARERATKP